MRIESVDVHGFGVLRDVSIDLTRYPDGSLVALSGPNGSGKSTLLELATGGACYRRCETRGNGTLASMARERDSSLEVRLVNGTPWTIRHSVDAVSGKSEALVLTADGEPAYGSTKVSDFGAWSAEHLPPPAIIYSCFVGVQDSHGFVGSKPGDRKAVLLRSMGLERLEELAKYSRAHATTAETEVSRLEGLTDIERTRASDAGQLEIELEAAQAEAANADRIAQEAYAELQAAQAEEAAAEAAAETYRVAKAARSRVEESLREARAKLTDLEHRIANNRAVLAESDVIRAAVERIAELEAQAAQTRQDAAQAERDAEAARREAAQAERQATAARARAAAAKGRAARAQELAGELESVREAEAQLPELRVAAEQAAEARNQANELLDELRGRRLAGAEERIGGLRGGLEDIRDGRFGAAATASDRASMALDDDDERVRLAEETPGLIRKATEEFEEAAFRARQSNDLLHRVESTAAMLDYVEGAGADLAAALADVAAADAEAAQHEAVSREASDRGVRLAEQHDRLKEGTLSCSAEIGELKPIAAKLKPLERAESRLSEIEPQASEWRDTVARLEAELEATQEPEAPTPAPDIHPLSTAYIGKSLDAQAASRAVTKLEERLRVAQQDAARAAELEEELGDAAAELADWKRLAQDLGRNGLQAALVDSVCAELTELVNSLLHECYGPRWTVSFLTQQPDASGKKQIEGLWIQVLDTVVGREGPIETYSGGERVFLGESVSLGLATIMCRRLGAERPTFIRDEPAGALDSEKEIAYVAMIRRAAGLIGASLVLLVSHSEQVKELCDERIEL